MGKLKESLVKPRTPIRRKKTYTESELIEAIAAIKDGMAINAAHRKFGIPRTTLKDNISDKYNPGKHTPGKNKLSNYG